MNRKSFLKMFIPAGIATVAMKDALAGSTGIDKPVKSSPTSIPPYLKPGDKVAITCPAGSVDAQKIIPCVRMLNKWGLKVEYGKTVGKRWHRFGGTDSERLQDFQEILDNPDIKAVIFGKGGYGTMRIIDQLNWDGFKKYPKWLVGYSDLTVVHLHVHNNLHIPTIHGDMGNGIYQDDPSSESLYNCLFGRKTEYVVNSHHLNRRGEVRGEIIGGNLTLVHACMASNSDVDTTGKILFLEDVNEYKYTIDRMLMSLKRSGKLDKLAALLVGQFTATRQEQEETFTMRLEEIIWEKVREYNYPVVFNFPSGHIYDNRALKMGIPHDLMVGKNWVILTESNPVLFPPVLSS